MLLTKQNEYIDVWELSKRQSAGYIPTQNDQAGKHDRPAVGWLVYVCIGSILNEEQEDWIHAIDKKDEACTLEDGYVERGCIVRAVAGNWHCIFVCYIV